MSPLITTQSANGVSRQTVLAYLKGNTESGSLIAEKIDEVFEVFQRQVESTDISEAGFQAVHSSIFAASSSNSEEHKNDSCHA